MKILVISNLFPPSTLGGYEILCGQVVTRLHRQGHDMTVVTTKDYESSTIEVVDGVRIHHCLELTHPFHEPAPFSRTGRMKTAAANLLATKRAILLEAPDVIFLWSQLRMTIGPSRAAEQSGVPVLYTFNDEHTAGYSPAAASLHPRRLASWFLDRTLFRSATHRGLRLSPATCISESLRSRLQAGGVPVDACRVLWQGIPIERFPMKSRAGSLADRPRVMYAGQLHRYKGVHTLIEAVHRVVDLERSVTLSIYGDGPPEYVAELQAQAGTGPAQVSFLGRAQQVELARAYREHDFLIFPSIWDEPFGLTHLEAMASGTPVVSTPNGGPGEFLVDGENALLFRAGDAAGLADRIIRLIRDDSLRWRLAVAGRTTVERDFTLDRYVASLERMLFDTRWAA